MTEFASITRSARSDKTLAVWFITAAAISVVGLSMHFVGLNGKWTWFDEACTLMTLVGFDDRAILGKVLSPEQLLAHFNLSRDNLGAEKIVENLRRSGPDQTPLYFLIAKTYAIVFGNTIASLRIFSAVCSILIVPLFYWLIHELTGSRRAAVIGVLIVSVSPYLMIYSAEARCYILLFAALLGMCIALLRFTRAANFSGGVAYALMLAFSTMLHLSTVILVPGQILFMVSQRVKWQAIIATLTPTAIAVSVWFALLGFGQNSFSKASTHHWSSIPVPVESWLEKMQLFLFRMFVDNGQEDSPLKLVVGFLAVALIVASFFVRGTTNRTRIFLLSLFSYSAVLIAMDMIIGGTRAVVSRYQTITIAAAYIATTLVIAALLDSRDRKFRITGAIMLTVIVGYGLISEFTVAQCHFPWTKSQQCNLPKTLQFLEAGEHPLLVTGSSEIAVSMAHMVPSKTKLELWRGDSKLIVPKDTDAIFLCLPWAPAKDLLEKRVREEFPTVRVESSK